MHRTRRRSNAFGPARLDFITLSDYVTKSGWPEIERFQAKYPGKLIARAAEVITYRGHIINHSSTYVDHRTGPVYDRAADGSLSLERDARPASEVFDAIHAANGWTQIAHPRIFPPEANPLNQFLCRGCSWQYPDAQTNFRKVDGIEVSTGPPAFGAMPNQFSVDALAFWQHALATGAHVAAFGASDTHHAGMPTNAAQAPLGTGTTVVHAKELSEQGIADGVRAGHTYAKLFGNAGPDVRLSAIDAAAARGPLKIMGDTVRARRVIIIASSRSDRKHVIPGNGPFTLLLQRNGKMIKKTTGPGALSMSITAKKAGRYGIVLMRGPLVVSVATPIWLAAK